jgi:hypothetical protein
MKKTSECLLNEVPNARENLTEEEIGTIRTQWNIFHRECYPDFNQYAQTRIMDKKKYGSIHGELID